MVWYVFGDEIITEKIGVKVMALLADLMICIILGIVFYFAETPLTERIISRANMWFEKREEA